MYCIWNQERILDGKIKIRPKIEHGRMKWELGNIGSLGIPRHPDDTHQSDLLCRNEMSWDETCEHCENDLRWYGIWNAIGSEIQLGRI